MKPTSKFGVLILVAPALLIYTFAVLIPFIGTIGLSFTRWNGFDVPEFAGIDNYIRAFHDTVFVSSFGHMLFYVASTLIVEVAVGLVLAGLITSRRFMGYPRVALFIPVMLPMVVIAVLWGAVFNPDFGAMNAFLGAVGLESWQQVWLGNPVTALPAISLVSGWIFAGFYMAIFNAAFARLPQDVLESARLDGANEWILFWRIKVPMIRQISTVAMLLCITGGIQGFDLFYVMTNGGPYNSTEVPTTYMVKAVFRDMEIGFGSSLSVILTVVGLVIAVFFRKWRGSQQADVEY